MFNTAPFNEQMYNDLAWYDADYEGQLVRDLEEEEIEELAEYEGVLLRILTQKEEFNGNIKKSLINLAIFNSEIVISLLDLVSYKANIIKKIVNIIDYKGNIDKNLSRIRKFVGTIKYKLNTALLIKNSITILINKFIKNSFIFYIKKNKLQLYIGRNKISLFNMIKYYNNINIKMFKFTILNLRIKKYNNAFVKFASRIKNYNFKQIIISNFSHRIITSFCNYLGITLRRFLKGVIFGKYVFVELPDEFTYKQIYFKHSFDELEQKYDFIQFY